MEDRYIQILRRLAIRGIGIESQLTDLVYRLFTNQSELPDNDLYDGINQDIVSMLEIMKGNKHLTYVKNTIMIEDIKYKTSYRYEYYGVLMDGGFKYLNEHLLTLSTIESNRIISGNSTLQSDALKRQTIILAFVGAFALVSMIYSIKTYNLDDQTKTLSLHIEKLQQDSIKSKK